jgi:4-aminobutyrate aminotransferase/(S)-3-amino-2-methylpropionate transaminase
MTLTSRYRPYKQGFGPFAPEVYRMPYPYPFRSPFGEEAGHQALAAIDRALQTMVDPSSIACAVVEPVQGEGGFVVPTPEFLPGLEEILHRYGILLVADEVQSGCGRTGRFLASEHFDYTPDIVVLAKSIASGYPLSAVVARSEIMDAPGPSAIGGTYVGNPVACAAGNAALQVIEEEGLVERAEQMGKTLRARWDDVAGEIDQIGEVRGLGAMIGVEFVKDGDAQGPNEEVVGGLIGEAMKRGVIAVSCGPDHNVLRHLMPLVMTDEELDEGLDVLTECAVAAARGRAAGPSEASEHAEGS